MAPRRLFNFIITDALADGLKALKERDGISESEQVRRAIADWLKAKGIRVAEPRKPRRKR